MFCVVRFIHICNLPTSRIRSSETGVQGVYPRRITGAYESNPDQRKEARNSQIREWTSRGQIIIMGLEPDAERSDAIAAIEKDIGTAQESISVGEIMD